MASTTNRKVTFEKSLYSVIFHRIFYRYRYYIVFDSVKFENSPYYPYTKMIKYSAIRIVQMNNVHVRDICRSKLCEEYTRQTQAVFTQWDSDLTKTKEQEDKLMVRKVCIMYLILL